MRWSALLLAAFALLLAPALAGADPIPQGATDAPAYEGRPATPRPVPAPVPPPHPFMAPNERSNLHNDAYQTDTNRRSGPLGDRPTVRSQFFVSECASVTFDARDRIVSVCVGVSDVTLRLLDPVTLESLASYPLPRRRPGAGAFTNFTGGGYFYLDNRDRAVVPTSERHVLVIGQTAAPGFALERDYDLTAAVPENDAIISALPDYRGRIWFASREGVVGTIEPATGTVRSLDTGEPIGNSFAVDADGSVSIVTDAALYRFEAGADGAPREVWRQPYDNVGTTKPGQTQAGSGTTPTLMGDDLVAITDNADPMNVVVYRRGARADGPRELCRVPVFARGASSTDQSLIATGSSIVVENNFGYTGPQATEGGRTTQPGLSRIDVDRAKGTCRVAWTSQERAPSVVPKLALGSGLVYTYTKPPRAQGDDPWYFTALDFATGETVYRVLAGEGLGFNNNFAPVTVGPDGTAYVGALGGILAVRDASPPAVAPAPVERPAAPAPRRDPKIAVRLVCRRGGGLQVRVRGARIAAVTARRRGARARRDARRPFRVRLARGGRRVTITVRRPSGERRVLVRRAPRCERRRASPS